MRRLRLIIVTCGLVLAGAHADPALGDERLQGTWAIVAAEMRGKAVPAEAVKDARIVFTDKTMNTIVDGKTVSSFKYKVNAQAKPESIDFEGTEGLFKGQAQPAIFEVSGPEMKLCISPHRKDRPEAFRTEEGKDWHLLILKREPPESPEPRNAADSR